MNFHIKPLPNEITKEIKSWLFGVERYNRLYHLQLRSNLGTKSSARRAFMGEILNMSRVLGEKPTIEVLDKVVNMIIQSGPSHTE